MNNYHTHTVFCDGKNTAEEMVEAALQGGAREIGFSGHSYLEDDPSWTMNPETEKLYIKEIERLKEKYKGRIDILLGIEQDFYSLPKGPSYEYSIGSVHCLYRDGHYISLDESPEKLREAVSLYYGGDPYLLAEDYYEKVSEVYDRTGCDIIGHFDLITKFNEVYPLFDTGNVRYRKAAERALERLLSSPAVFEVNYGAISRGYRTSPYPENFILSAVKSAGKPVILSSDSHSAETVLFGFSEGERLLRDMGLERLESLREFKKNG